MRILLSEKSREELFDYLKRKNNARNLKELSSKIKIPFKTLQKWRYGNLLLPHFIIPKELDSLQIIEEQKDNWGQSKGGKTGNKKHLKEIWKNEEYRKTMRENGRKVVSKLWKKYGKEELIKMTIAGKIRKREKESKELEDNNKSLFINERVKLDLQYITYSSTDKKKKINFPMEITKELAEEIGVHLGDGCMSLNRNYFSVKTNKKEEEYMRNYLIPLYKKVYNLDLKLMTLPSVVGFEVCSKALCEFKNKVIGLPYGEKIHRIEVPRAVIDTKNKEIYCALIRGLFDTDGCLSIIKRNNKEYPTISITIKSERLIQQIEDMFRKMGFIPHSNKKSYIVLNGWVMLKKWIEEIGSNNLKNILNLKRASSSVDRIFPCGLKQ